MGKKEKDSDKLSKGLLEVLSFALYLVVAIIVTFCIIKFVGQRTIVDGSSMENTLSDGDNLIVDKISYKFGDPQRFDIIVFPYQHKEDTHYIKRIIGLPGETVQIIDGKIFINDEVLEESYGKEVMTYAGVAAEPIVLGPDEYFVLGDNRNDSSDSRFTLVGNIKRDDIVGRAWLRIWPFSKFGFVKHQ